MRIRAFIYEADYHCVDCAITRFGDNILECDDSTIDNEGNPITPLYSWELSSYYTHCGDCNEELI